MGRAADRFGNRPVMIATLTVVASGPAFFLLAGVAGSWRLIGGVQEGWHGELSTVTAGKPAC